MDSAQRQIAGRLFMRVEGMGEKQIYVLAERALFFSRWFDKGAAVESEKPLTPPFEKYDPSKHGENITPIDLDSWVELVK